MSKLSAHIIFFLIFLGLPAKSQVSNPDSCLLFSSDEVLHFNLRADFTSILERMKTDSVWHDGALLYTEPDGETKEIPVNIRVRGVFRRDPSNCNFPPLKLSFKNRTANGTIFQGVNSLKLVSHCRTNHRYYEQCVVQEYLVYRMYNLFTDYSYRARLARINYINGNDTIRQMGILLEPTALLADRNACHEIDLENVHPNFIQHQHATMFALFQFMIGNTDWSVPALHNVTLLQKDDELPFAVPFDFDCSGIVNSPYAVPQPSLGIPSVRVRLFRGYCRTEYEFEACFRLFEENHDQIIRLYTGCEYLSHQSRKQALRYIEEFYEIIRDPRKYRPLILNQCRS